MKNEKPTLLIFAAGRGSRYGGLKQLESIGPNGERIIDYSVYDAAQAGFGKVVVVISEEFEQKFTEEVLPEISKLLHTEYVVQKLNYFTENTPYSKDRAKPWGTAHALICAESKITTPFAIINADDFYGREPFKLLKIFFEKERNENEAVLIGFKLINTLSPFGSVSRGILKLDENQFIKEISEGTKIFGQGSKIFRELENGKITELNGENFISMNIFGFYPSIFNEAKKSFGEFLRENAFNNDAEFRIPELVNELIKAGKLKVKVVGTTSKWFGLTYKEDKLLAVRNINELIAKGEYPENLYETIKKEK